MRAVAALSAHRDVQLVGRRADGTGRDTDPVGGNARVDVQHGDRFHFRIVQGAFVDHWLRAAGAFFGRLKEQHDRARKRLAHGGENSRRAQQHRRVRVVTACVHLARNFGCKR